MNVLVVDTSVWISYFKGHPIQELDVGLNEGRVYLPSLVVSELLSGQVSSSQRIQLISFLKDLAFCECDFDHWSRVGLLRRKLASRGMTISTPDAHVAQCALDLEGYLMSEDKIFNKILKVVPELKLRVS